MDGMRDTVPRGVAGCMRTPCSVKGNFGFFVSWRSNLVNVTYVPKSRHVSILFLDVVR
jgi:hypothetical protein